MQKHETHQIDELAQQIFRSSIPVTWVVNEQHRDYGKDYLIEVGEDDGNLTGSSFYVQLKGQGNSTTNANGSVVKFSLESKYATYYFDKVKDLPVFLIVVDVTVKKARWIFLQQVLEADQSWRWKKGISIGLPVANDLVNVVSFRSAVENAKKWLCFRQPKSIHEAVVAQKERIVKTDPRFDVTVSLVNDHPNFTLHAKEDVDLTFTFKGDQDEIVKKVSDLIDKGTAVVFQPGEVSVAGSKLFEHIEQSGCSIQAAVNFGGTVNLICEDSGRNEMARLGDLPAKVSGGQNELWISAQLEKSPFDLRLGPFTPHSGGSCNVNLQLKQWNGQSLLQLAYFDRIHRFFQAWPTSAFTTVEFEKDGNKLLSMTQPSVTQPHAMHLARYLDALSKARFVAKRFDANPVWTVEQFDEAMIETCEMLHAVFFGNGWKKAMPNVRLSASCIRDTFQFDVGQKAEKCGHVRIIAPHQFILLGETIDVGFLNYDYSDMKVEIIDGSASTPLQNGKKRKGPRKRSPGILPNDAVEIALIGSAATVWFVQLAGDTQSAAEPEMLLLSAQTKADLP